jgi:chemotaxis receptor (MCP) glutamine deamidase CheD
MGQGRGCFPSESSECARRRVRRKRLDIGDVIAGQGQLILHTLLGSCVAVCLRDPVSGVGGMNHILVPSSSTDAGLTTRCGVQAMELLINEVMKLGGERRRLVAKAFGGANVLHGFQSPTVGELNVSFVRQFLLEEKIPLVAQRLGGASAVTVSFHLDSGEVIVRSVDGSRLPAILREETSYYETSAASRFQVEEPVLF